MDTVKRDKLWVFKCVCGWQAASPYKWLIAFVRRVHKRVGTRHRQAE